MSSPRGLVDGGIGGIGTDIPRLRSGLLVNLSGIGVRADRPSKNENGLISSLERNGFCRTLRYMLKLRKARLACGTYLQNSYYDGQLNVREQNKKDRTRTY